MITTLTSDAMPFPQTALPLSFRSDRAIRLDSTRRSRRPRHKTGKSECADAIFE